jgi:hypothetical protein
MELWAWDTFLYTLLFFKSYIVPRNVESKVHQPYPH